MTHNYLLEIGIEEIPAHIVTPSINQLKKRVTDFLKDNKLAFDSIDSFSTPRRLTVRINGLADQQPDVEEDAKGPAKKIALDDEGNWTKAAIGFSRGQGVTPDDITFKEVKGTEYVFVHKEVKGKSVTELLPQIKSVIEAMNFPTMMKWADYDFKFVRPIRWIVSLLDNEVIPFSILDVKAGNQTEGHRFLGHEVEIKQPADYEATLKDQFVLVDAQARKELIRSQIHQIADDNNWDVQPNADLLEEVNNLVEWPTAFSGSFNTKYLDIPEEVLITSMRDHQRFFFVRDQAGKLLPNFISVRNGNSEFIDNVACGNEKVLTARLEDAAFFYNEDQQHPIDYYVEKLKKVSFHDKIGSMYEKMNRVRVIADVLANSIGLSQDEKHDLSRAASIYKFDLVTGMVGEFPELQGVMGEKYTLLNDENASVATAIREHYMPTSANGDLPESTVGSVLALADKFDNLFSFFGADMIPSGSNDPYALRRQAFGIVRILKEQNWHLQLNVLQEAVSKQLDTENAAGGVDVNKNANEVRQFISDRVRQWLDNQKTDHDIVETVVNSSNTDILNMITAAQLLKESRTTDDKFKDSIEALTRVLRISEKNENKNDLTVDSKLFNNDSETELFNHVKSIQDADRDLKNDYEKLLALEPVISKYFDETMVMDKDESIKNNRLNQLTILSNLIKPIGDLNQMIVK